MGSSRVPFLFCTLARPIASSNGSTFAINPQSDPRRWRAAGGKRERVVLGTLLVGLALSPLSAQTVTFQGLITTVAGNGTVGYNGDNIVATNARLSAPKDVVVDGSGNFYIADAGNHRVRKVTLDGIISTVVGGGTGCVGETDSMGDGCQATSAKLVNPYSLAVDGSGNIYVADLNSVRKVDRATGIITTVAGNGTEGYNGDNIAATSAALYLPYDVALDHNRNLYIADTSNDRIRKVDAVTGLITTVAGGGTLVGGVYCVNQTDARGDGCPATSAVLYLPVGIALDSSGNLYITDEADGYDQLVRKVSAATGVITTVAGGGSTPYCATSTDNEGDGCPATSANLDYPTGVAVNESGDVYITEEIGDRIRKVDAGTGVITAVAGTGATFGSFTGDGGPATSAQLNVPFKSAVDGSDNLYIADSSNNRIRKVGISSANFVPVNVGQSSSTYSIGFSFTAATTVGSIAVVTQGASALDFTDAGTGTCTTNGTSHTYNAGDSCTVNVTFAPKFAGPRYGAVNLLDGSGTVIATVYVYGTGQAPELVFNGNPTVQALGGGFSSLAGMAVDANGNVYVADEGNNAVKEIPHGCALSSCVATLGGGFSQPTGVAVDGSGNVYVADWGNSAVKEMPPGCALSACVSTLGGGFNQATGVAVDGSGNVYIADSGSGTVKEMPQGCASSGCVTSLVSGIGNIHGIALDGAGDVYISASPAAGATIDEIPPGCTSLSCVIILGGPPATAFEDPVGLAVDPAGDVYVADLLTDSVKEMPPGCSSSSCVRTLQSGITESSARGVGLDGWGDVYVTSSYGTASELILVLPSPMIFSSTNVGSQSSDSPQSHTLTNIGNAPLIFPVPATGENPAVSTNFVLDALTTCPEVSSSSSAGMLAAGGSCVLALDFAPTTSGPITGSVVLTDNILNLANATQNIGLSGTGLAALITPTVTVLPASSAITTAQADQVTITVNGGNGNPTPTGLVTLSSGSYNSGATTLSSGSAMITVPAGALALGSDTLTATYSGDSNYNSAMGTAPVTVTQSSGCTTGNPNPNPNPAALGVPVDFNADCKSDILWRNTSNGQVATWFINGTALSSSGIPGTVPAAWVIQGAGDFNGDGKSDILWRNTSTGQVAIWLMNGTSMASSGTLGNVASSWVIQGVGDFNGDGKSDILWRNSGTGQVAIWLMNGTTIASSANTATVANSWAIQGTGDFDGDGKSDLLWRNTSTGQVAIWLMNGTVIASSANTATVANNWAIQGVGDFDGDGKSDILWRNTGTGQVAIWLMNGTALSSSGTLSTVPAAWVIQGAGDFNGDGKSDILWRNTSNGQVAIWLMNGTTLASSGTPGTVSAAWQIAAPSP